MADETTAFLAEIFPTTTLHYLDALCLVLRLMKYSSHRIHPFNLEVGILFSPLATPGLCILQMSWKPCYLRKHPRDIFLSGNVFRWCPPPTSCITASTISLLFTASKIISCSTFLLEVYAAVDWETMILERKKRLSHGNSRLSENWQLLKIAVRRTLAPEALLLHMSGCSIFNMVQ